MTHPSYSESLAYGPILPEDFDTKAAELRSKLENHESEDVKAHFGKQPEDGNDYLRRFLIARTFNIDDAIAKVVLDTEFWKTFVPADMEEVLLQYQKGIFFFGNGFDKRGLPLLMFKAAKHKKGSITKEEMVRIIVRLATSIVEGCGTPGFTLVVDLAGFGLLQADLGVLKELMGALQLSFPERMGHCIILNAPWSFWSFWKLAAVFLNPRTKNKIHFLAQKDVGKFIDPEQLTCDFGGKGSALNDSLSFDEAVETMVSSHTEFHKLNSESIALARADVRNNGGVPTEVKK